MQAQRCFVVRYAKQQLLPLLLAKNPNRQYCQTPRRSLSFLSNEKALRILGLGSTNAQQQVHVHLLTQPQLRKAYLAAAKRYHPDTIHITTVDPDQEEDKHQRRTEAAKKFHLVSEAFEALQSRISGTKMSGYSWSDEREEEESTADGAYGNGNLSSYEEEQSFRQACIDVLQVPAHIVEEAKRDPAFLQWLQGNTDAAHLWRDFLHQHGGMAPVLATSNARQPSFLPLKGAGPVRRSRRR
jgi:hypothetical protein